MSSEELKKFIDEYVKLGYFMAAKNSINYFTMSSRKVSDIFLIIYTKLRKRGIEAYHQI